MASTGRGKQERLLSSGYLYHKQLMTVTLSSILSLPPFDAMALYLSGLFSPFLPDDADALDDDDDGAVVLKRQRLEWRSLFVLCPIAACLPRTLGAT